MTSYTLLIEPHYLPTIACFKKIYETEALHLEVCGRYKKKTLQNRCYLATRQGLQRLTIPVAHHTTRGCYRDVKIDYEMPWPLQHMGAIRTAYGRMPYYEVLEDLLFPIFLQRPTFLLDITLPMITACCTFLRLGKKIMLTKEYNVETTPGVMDLRGHFTHKNRVEDGENPLKSPNLSVLHLLATRGCYAHEHLAAFCD